VGLALISIFLVTFCLVGPCAEAVKLVIERAKMMVSAEIIRFFKFEQNEFNKLRIQFLPWIFNQVRRQICYRQALLALKLSVFFYQQIGKYDQVVCLLDRFFAGAFFVGVFRVAAFLGVGFFEAVF
jgi:hypothetical protein